MGWKLETPTQRGESAMVSESLCEIRDLGRNCILDVHRGCLDAHPVKYNFRRESPSANLENLKGFSQSSYSEVCRETLPAVGDGTH